MTEKRERLKELPAVQDILKEASVEKASSGMPRALVLSAVRAEIAAARGRLLAGGNGDPRGTKSLIEKEIVEAVKARLARESRLGPLRVINATGVIVHTNLGRAPLAAEAMEHLVEVARGYCTLEYDLAQGVRGSRQSHLEKLLTEATGAEAALAVNNNAAAVMLTLAALVPAGKEVIVSRGELVEIGGSFRVPDILRLSGAKLVEVGTTNRTHLKDYQAALGPETALLLKVHPSNFRVVGFTAEVSLEELGELARGAKLPLVADLGSGMLHDLAAHGVKGEPSPRAVLKHADLVTFSGDKLLGGPQAGIIAGKAVLVGKAKSHPLARAVRIDKLSLAALAATLRLALDPALAKAIPVIRMIEEEIESVLARAGKIAKGLKKTGAKLDLVETEAAFGGGSVPGKTLPSVAVRIGGLAPEPLEEKLRTGPLPVIARVEDGALLLDARTIADAEVEELVIQVTRALGPG